MSALLSATRPTRRDIARHPWRILAAVLLIALPVFVGSWMSTTEHSTSEAVMGSTIRTSAELSGGSCEQSVDLSRHDCEGDPVPGTALALLEEHLPEGFEAELHYTTWGSASTEHRRTSLSIRQRATGTLPPRGISTCPPPRRRRCGSGSATPSPSLPTARMRSL